MADVLMFKKPPKKTIEDIFFDSLSDQQIEMFSEIMAEIEADYEDLQNKLLKKIAECEMLRLENKKLRGEKDET